MKKFTRQLQQGFSLITAIFLLVVLGTLGTMMVTFFVAQQQSSTIDVLGSRAYQAARAGVEWASYNVGITPQGTAWAGCAGAASAPFAANTLAGNLSPFTVTVDCTTAAAVEGTATINWYVVTSTAHNGLAASSKDRIERQITATMGR